MTQMAKGKRLSCRKRHARGVQGCLRQTGIHNIQPDRLQHQVLHQPRQYPFPDRRRWSRQRWGSSLECLLVRPWRTGCCAPYLVAAGGVSYLAYADGISNGVIGDQDDAPFLCLAEDARATDDNRLYRSNRGTTVQGIYDNYINKVELSPVQRWTVAIEDAPFKQTEAFLENVRAVTGLITQDNLRASRITARNTPITTLSPDQARPCRGICLAEIRTQPKGEAKILSRGALEITSPPRFPAHEGLLSPAGYPYGFRWLP